MQQSAYIQHDGTTDRESMIGELMDVSAESMANANSMLSMLTAESKFVLYAIFNTPGELSKLLFDSRPSKEKVKKYLRLMGWKKKYIRKTLKELDNFTTELFS